jgi:hypothetical protein
MTESPAKNAKEFSEQVSTSSHLLKAFDKESDDYIKFLNSKGGVGACALVLSYFFDSKEALVRMDMALRTRALVLKVAEAALSFMRIVDKQVSAENLN